MPGICSITNFITGFKSRSVMFWIIIIDTNKEPSWICSSWSVSSYPNKHTFKILLEMITICMPVDISDESNIKKWRKRIDKIEQNLFPHHTFVPLSRKNEDASCIENIIPGCRRWFSHLHETIWKHLLSYEEMIPRLGRMIRKNKVCWRLES